MRSIDWSRTPLGPTATWPQSLRTTVSTCLNSRFPILIWWGPQFVKLYNDAYRQVLGAKHPHALGAPGREVWPEIWHIIGPMLDGVVKEGRATWSEDQFLPSSPSRDPSGCRCATAAIAVLALDVTEVVNARREAEAANVAKDEFLAMLGHELRSPLSPILTAIRLLQLKALPIRSWNNFARRSSGRRCACPGSWTVCWTSGGSSRASSTWTGSRWSILLDVDPVGIVRGRGGKGGAEDQYVNDRPYVASSLLSVVLSRWFNSALAGRCEQKPELVASELPLEARLAAVPCRGGEAFLRGLFEPLGQAVEATRHELDESMPALGPSRLFTVTLRATRRLSDLLTHLYVLIPVLDDQKHYWVGDDEVSRSCFVTGKAGVTAPPRAMPSSCAISFISEGLFVTPSPGTNEEVARI